MSDTKISNRLVSSDLELSGKLIIDADVYPPSNGTEVLGYTIGGVWVRCVVSKSNRKHILAYIAFPKLPLWLKAKLRSAYQESFHALEQDLNG